MGGHWCVRETLNRRSGRGRGHEPGRHPPAPLSVRNGDLQSGRAQLARAGGVPIGSTIV